MVQHQDFAKFWEKISERAKLVTVNWFFDRFASNPASRERIASRLVEVCKPENVETVAVVGGSSNEPELAEYSKAAVTIIGNDGKSDVFLDLNQSQPITQSFDLVLCSQVLEHVHDLEIAFANLKALTKPNGGTLLIAVPASGWVHGEPDYYFAGFDVQLIKRMCERNSLEVMACERLSSRKAYLASHNYGLWLVDSGDFRNPWSLVRHCKSSVEKIHFLVRYFLPLLKISFTRDSNDKRWAISSYVICRL